MSIEALSDHYPRPDLPLPGSTARSQCARSAYADRDVPAGHATARAVRLPGTSRFQHHEMRPGRFAELDGSRELIPGPADRGKDHAGHAVKEEAKLPEEPKEPKASKTPQEPKK